MSISAERMTTMSKFSDFLDQQLNDPGVRAEYDALSSEFAIAQAMIDERNSFDLIHKEQLKQHPTEGIYDNRI